LKTPERAHNLNKKRVIYFFCLVGIYLSLAFAHIGRAESLNMPGDPGTPHHWNSFGLTEDYKLCSPLALTPLIELPKIISAPYKPPPRGSEERHHGVDFAYYRKHGRASIAGEGVQAVLGGKVVAAINDLFPYGNMVIVETPFSDISVKLAGNLGLAQGESLYVLYAHMEEEPLVKLGDELKACQPLGRVGKSGNAGNMTHLHLETRRGPAGAVFYSMAYYDSQATPLEKQNYKLWRTSGLFQHFDPMQLLSINPK
jgi:murein DD-endopeptidase MepM/ murein hydrolase activator NlpD